MDGSACFASTLYIVWGFHNPEMIPGVALIRLLRVRSARGETCCGIKGEVNLLDLGNSCWADLVMRLNEPLICGSLIHITSDDWAVESSYLPCRKMGPADRDLRVG